MSGEMARSPDRTSFGAAGTPQALRRPPVASRAPRRLLSFTPFQSSSGECRFRKIFGWLIRSAGLSLPADTHGGLLNGFSSVVFRQCGNGLASAEANVGQHAIVRTRHHNANRTSDSLFELGPFFLER